jgi:NADP-reducing hydrogenase subunit HndB
MSKKIASPADLKAIRDKAKAEVDLRSGPKEIQITVHMGTCGIAAGARDVMSSLMDELGTANTDNVTLRQSGCAGLCDREPMFTLTDKLGQTFRYGRLDRNKVHKIVQEHILSGNPVVDFLISR